MSGEQMSILAGSVLILLIVAGIVARRLPRKLKVDKYSSAWKDVQTCCKEKSNWGEAIIAADKLLDRALKRRKIKGKSMGERMVSAQRTFTNNDGLWFAHNLYKKILIEPDLKLKETDVKDALMSYRQALRDLGALQNVDTRNTQ